MPPKNHSSGSCSVRQRPKKNEGRRRPGRQRCPPLPTGAGMRFWPCSAQACCKVYFLTKNKAALRAGLGVHCGPLSESVCQPGLVGPPAARQSCPQPCLPLMPRRTPSCTAKCGGHHCADGLLPLTGSSSWKEGQCPPLFFFSEPPFSTTP